MLIDQPSDEGHPYPDWVCLDCGSVEGFRPERYETDLGTEYCTICLECGSEDVEEQAGGIPTIIEAAEARGRESIIEIIKRTVAPVCLCGPGDVCGLQSEVQMLLEECGLENWKPEDDR